MLRIIATRKDLADVIVAKSGYLYNDYGGRDPKLCPIHDLGACPWLPSMLRVAPGPLSVRKLWSDDLAELVRAIMARGRVFGPCRSEPSIVLRLSELVPGRPTDSIRPGVVPERRGDPASAGDSGNRPRELAESSHAFAVEADPVARVVRAWCRARLTFEPRGDMLRLREALAGAVRVLDGDGILHAVYVSADAVVADTENVLIYNVGTGRFRRSSARGLRFERHLSTPEPAPDGRLFGHHHRYAMAPVSSQPAHWQEGRMLARWDREPLAVPLESMRVGDVWRSMTRGHALIEPDPARGWLGVRVRAHVPPESACSAAAVVKPLVDGVVAALHRHDGSDLEELAARLERLHGIDPARSRARLMDPERAVLGERRLLWRWKDGVQWNPGDDACVLGEVWIDADAALGATMLSAEVFEVSALEAS